MARSNQQKRYDLIASTAHSNKVFTTAAICRVFPNNKIDIDNMFARFLLNPSAWEEHKSSNWIAHQIPGESDPILQWTSGGARTITVDALVTKDHSGYDLVSPPDPIAKLVDQALTVVGNIASSFLGINVPAIGDLLPIGDQGEGENLSIESYLNYYRSLMYPLTENDKSTLAGAPPLVALFVGKTLSKNLASADISVDTDLWVVTDLRIRVTKQLPNLAPMEATVSFQLTQYIRRTKDQSDFTPGSPDQMAAPSSPGQFLVDKVAGFFK